MRKSKLMVGQNYRQKSDGIDGKLIVLGVPHDCGMTAVCRL